jgi:hypothetical protein
MVTPPKPKLVVVYVQRLELLVLVFLVTEVVG